MKLNNLYNMTNGVFADLQILEVPWKDKGIATELDIMYIGNHSGQKTISPMLRQFVENGEITPANRSQIASVLFALYNDNWVREYNTLFLEYDPIENYHSIEEMTNDETVVEYGRTDTRTDNIEHSIEGSESLIHNTKDEHRSSTNDKKNGSEVRRPIIETDNQVYAFNTGQNIQDALHSTKVINSGTETMDYNGVTNEGEEVSESKVTGTDTTQYNNRVNKDTGTSANTASGEDTHTRNYHLERSGNIGVTTSQQMITSERELYLWNFFERVVFPDIDRALTLKIY